MPLLENNTYEEYLFTVINCDIRMINRLNTGFVQTNCGELRKTLRAISTRMYRHINLLTEDDKFKLYEIMNVVTNG